MAASEWLCSERVYIITSLLARVEKMSLRVAAVSNVSATSTNGSKARKKCTEGCDFRFDYFGHNSSGTIFIGSQVKENSASNGVSCFISMGLHSKSIP
jgi:hypothetical protein